MHAQKNTTLLIYTTYPFLKASICFARVLHDPIVTLLWPYCDPVVTLLWPCCGPLRHREACLFLASAATENTRSMQTWQQSVRILSRWQGRRSRLPCQIILLCRKTELSTLFSICLRSLFVRLPSSPESFTWTTWTLRCAFPNQASLVNT